MAIPPNNNGAVVGRPQVTVNTHNRRIRRIRETVIKINNAAALMRGEDTDESFQALGEFQDDMNQLPFEFLEVFFNKIADVHIERKLQYVMHFLLHVNVYLTNGTLVNEDFANNEFRSLDYLVRTQNLDLSRIFLVDEDQDPLTSYEIPPEIGNNLISKSLWRLNLRGALFSRIVVNRRVRASLQRVRDARININ